MVTRDLPTVLVVWYAIPDVDNLEQEESLLLDPTKWQNNGKCGWRKYIDVELYDNYYCMMIMIVWLNQRTMIILWRNLNMILTMWL